MMVNDANAMEIYHCEQLRGKSTWIGERAIDWVDDFYGTSTVFLDDSRFIVSAGSSVPGDLKEIVGDDRTVYDLDVTSRDEDHVIGVDSRTGSLNVFQFHRPTKMLVNVGTRIDNFALPGSSMRNGNALAFVAQCR